MYYSSITDNIDYMSFTNLKTNKGLFTGTSCAAPCFASMLALVQGFFKEKIGRKLTHEELIEFIKEHTQDLDSISEDTVIEVFKAAKIVKEKLIEKLNIDGCTLVQNNGYGQEVKHYHLHMIPRVVDDQIGMTHDSHGVRPAEDVFKMMQ